MKKIIIEVNHNLELMNRILMMSKYNELTKPHIGYELMTEESNEYTTALKEFLTPYNSDRIFDMIKSMIPNGFTFSRPVELILATKGDNEVNSAVTDLLTLWFKNKSVTAVAIAYIIYKIC